MIALSFTGELKRVTCSGGMDGGGEEVEQRRHGETSLRSTTTTATHPLLLTERIYLYVVQFKVMCE